MALLRGFWRLLVGIKDLFVLAAMLLFFGLLYAVLAARPAPVEPGMLDLRLAGRIVEQPSRPGLGEWLSGTAQRLSEHDRGALVETLHAAAKDERVKGVALDLEGFLGGGQVALADVGAALDAVRDAGKPVVAYATYYTDDGYQLAAHASEIWLDPLGAVALAGPGGSNLYFAGLLERLGVTAHVYRAGTYKSAVEPFLRNDMSPEARANTTALANTLLATWRADVERARPRAKLQPALFDPVAQVRAAGGDLARAALDGGLVDKIGPREAFEARLAAIGGKSETRGYRGTAWHDYDADRPRAPGGRIGLVTIAGTIVDGDAAPGTAGADEIAERIHEALNSGRLKALVVRIDSPGGSVTGSERIRLALAAARRRGLPVIVSMGNVAASGGYWIATAGDEIFAEPATITGSIGVFGVMPSFEGSLKKLGIGVDGVKTTPLSGEPDLLGGVSPAIDTLMQASVDQHYRRFLSLVASSRRKSVGEVERVASGRVWDGGSARQLGLVDRFGGLDEAIARAGERAGLDADERGVVRIERGASALDRLAGMVFAEPPARGAPVASLRAVAGPGTDELAARLAELAALADAPTLQARCLDCPAPTGSAAPGLANGGLLRWLARLLG